MPNAIANNPAIVTGLIRAVLAALIVLGLQLTPEQEAALIVVVSLAISFVTARLTVPKTPAPPVPPEAVQQPPASGV